MENMYEEIIPTPRRKAPKGRRTLGILLGIVVVLFALLAYPAIRIMVHKTQYNQFISALSTATTRTYAKGGLTAQLDGVTLEVKQENIAGIYGVIAKQGSCYISNDQPRREPDVHLDYGISGTMDLWEVPLENDPSGLDSGVYIHFSSPGEEGVDFSYIMAGKPLPDICSLFLSPQLNTPVS